MDPYSLSVLFNREYKKHRRQRYNWQPEVLQWVLSRPPFLLPSLVIRLNACLENFWLTKPVGVFFAFFVSSSFRTLVSSRRNSLASRHSTWSSSSSSALTSSDDLPSSPPSPPSRRISTLILCLGRVPFVRPFLPLVPHTSRLMLFLVGGPPFARRAV